MTKRPLLRQQYVAITRATLNAKCDIGLYFNSFLLYLRVFRGISGYDGHNTGLVHPQLCFAFHVSGFVSSRLMDLFIIWLLLWGSHIPPALGQCLASAGAASFTLARYWPSTGPVLDQLYLAWQIWQSSWLMTAVFSCYMISISHYQSGGRIGMNEWVSEWVGVPISRAHYCEYVLWQYCDNTMWSRILENTILVSTTNICE